MSLYIYIKNFTLRDQIIAALVALIVSLVLSVEALDVCTRIPLSNSTVITNNRVLSSVRVDFNFRDLGKMCMVNSYGNEFRIDVASWSNRFKLDCYETDDPLQLSDKDTTPSYQTAFIDKSICTCIAPRVLDIEDTLCLGNYHKILRTHNAKACPFWAVKGTDNRYRFDVCFYGFERFKVCKITKDPSFEVDFLIHKTFNQSFNVIDFEHRDKKSVYDDGELILTTLVRYDNQFEGKYIILDSKTDEKFWMVDAKYVNEGDERDIRKIGWFRKKDTEYHRDLITNQLTIKIDDCVENKMELYEKPLSISKFLDSMPDTSFGKYYHGQVQDASGKIYYSSGKPNSEFFNYPILKIGFMVKSKADVLFIGITKDNNVLGDFYSSEPGPWENYNTELLGGFTTESTCPKDHMVVGGFDAKVSRQFYDTTGTNRIQIYTHLSKDGANCVRQGIMYNQYWATSFKTRLWPTMREYECKVNRKPDFTGDGMIYCKRTFSENDEEAGTDIIDIFKDDSYAELNIQATFNIKSEELVEPEIKDVKLNCKEGVCSIEFKKVKGNFITFKFSDCFNDLITNETKSDLFAYSDCIKLVETKMSFQDKTLYSRIDKVNCTKSVNYELTTGKPEGIKLPELPDIDLSDIINFLMYYWYWFLIGLIILGLIIFAVVSWYIKRNVQVLKSGFNQLMIKKNK